MISLILVFCLAWLAYERWSSPNETGGKSRADALRIIRNLMQQFQISPQELLMPLSPTAAPEPSKKNFGEMGSRIFGYLGGVLLLAGFGAFITNFWDHIGSVGRVAITLGSGIVIQCISALFLREARYPRAILPLLIASAWLQTVGWSVFIVEYFPAGLNLQKAVLAVCTVMALVQGGMWLAFRRTILAFLALAYLYGALQALLDLQGIDLKIILLLLGCSLLIIADRLKPAHAVLTPIAYAIGGLWFYTGELFLLEDMVNIRWVALVIGISIMSFGYAMNLVREGMLAALAYFFGSIMFYSGLFDLVYNTPIELLYLGSAIGMMVVCIVLQSRALLFTSVCALLGYIGYYTQKYFVDSLGWPLALMVMGLACLAVGMLAFRVRVKYFNPPD